MSKILILLRNLFYNFQFSIIIGKYWPNELEHLIIIVKEKIEVGHIKSISCDELNQVGLNQ